MGLWLEHNFELLGVVSRVADPNEADQVLEVALKTECMAEQTGLEQSTAAAASLSSRSHVWPCPRKTPTPWCDPEWR